MRRRRRFEDEPENHERWLVSYADFITLLFAFFVVMYSLSSINEGKYRVLSTSLVNAFKSSTGPVGTQLIASGPIVPPPLPLIKPKTMQQQAREQQAERMRKLAKEVTRVMAPYVTGGQVAVIETDRGVTIEINDSMLFPPGRSELTIQAVQAMRGVGAVFAETDFPVTIEGHTDNMPISTPLFPSNWELSAVRATTVLRLMIDAGVGSGRLTAIGYGDQHPIADNASAEGRARNRRVAITLEASVPLDSQQGVVRR